jgi:hypothetical protein
MRASKRKQVVDHAVNASELALKLAQDRRFRERLISALQHGSNARRCTLRLASTTAQLASDARIHAELHAARTDLAKAYARLDAKRTGRRLRKLVLAAAVASLATVPALRRKGWEFATAAPIGGKTRLRQPEHQDEPAGADRAAAAQTALEGLTRDELYSRAQAADIPGRSDMSKDELISALRQQAT